MSMWKVRTALVAAVAEVDDEDVAEALHAALDVIDGEGDIVEAATLIAKAKKKQSLRDQREEVETKLSNLMHDNKNNGVNQRKGTGALRKRLKELDEQIAARRSVLAETAVISSATPGATFRIRSGKSR